MKNVDGRRRTPDHGYTISSPCEPEGSGELKSTSRKVAAEWSQFSPIATKSGKVAATKCRKVAATKSSKTNLHMKNSQAATMPQLAAAAKPHACCLFAAIHCEKPFISIRVKRVEVVTISEIYYLGYFKVKYNINYIAEAFL